jgi:hypothetical protein
VSGTPFDERPDPGLASERTDLAWNRSGLALLACGAAVARGITVGEPNPGHIAVGVTIHVTVPVMGSHVRSRRGVTCSRSPPGPSPSASRRSSSEPSSRADASLSNRGVPGCYELHPSRRGSDGVEEVS